MPFINRLGGGGEDVTPEVTAQTPKVENLLKALKNKVNEPLWLANDEGEIITPLIPVDQPVQTSGLTITVKKDDNPLGYVITSLSVNDTAPVKTENTITNGVLKLEAFGAQYTGIEYSILEEN